MESKGFFIGEAIKKGWSIFQKYIGFFILIVLFMLVVSLIAQFLPSLAKQQQSSLLHFILSLITFVISILLAMGWIQIALIASTEEKPQFSDFFRPIPKFFSYLVATFFYFVIVFVGLLLLVFPGVIWGLRYGLYPYFVIDQGEGPIQALKSSAKTTYGAKWDLLGLYAVCFLITLLGIAVLLVGTLATTPLVAIAHAWVYRKLLAKTPLSAT